MTTNTDSASAGAQEPSAFDAVANQYAQAVFLALLAVAGALAVTVAALAYFKGTAVLSLEIWLGGLAFVCAAVGIAYNAALNAESLKTISRADVLRLATLAAGGLVGFVTFFYGVVLITWDYPAVFTGKIEVMRENLRTIVLCAVPLFFGTIFMYAGLALGRKFERSRAGLRRLLYGYNSVLGALLLLAILGIVNLLAYTHVKPFSALGSTLDWSGTGLYTLTEGTRNTVARLKQPVEVKAILRRGDPIVDKVETMLDNCHSVNHEFRYQIVSPTADDSTIQELLKKYPIPGEGLLILYGPEGSQVSEFIKRDDLVVVPPFNMRDPDAQRQTLFQGEYALEKTLSYLEEGRTHTTVYFTQGQGELDYNDRSAGARGKGLGTLVDELGKGNYDLSQGPATELPEKADVVVIAGPKKPFSPDALAALRRYLRPDDGKKPGKLIVLFDVGIVDGKMVKTGLEDLVADYNVNVGDNQILCARARNPRDVPIIPNQDVGNPIPKAFYNGERIYQFTWNNVRTVEPGQPNPARPFTTETLFVADPNGYIWVEDNLAADPGALAADLRKNTQKLMQRLARTPVPVAVAVSESSGGPVPPGHPPLGGQKPVLIAFGGDGWLSNAEVEGGAGFTIFTNCVGWLRERPVIGEMPTPPKPPTYEFNVEDDQRRRMYWLPGFLILLTIISMSLGVWLVRRR